MIDSNDIADGSLAPVQSRDEALARVAAQRTELEQRFAASSLALFGSAARDELNAASDIDVLVEFDGPASFERYFGLKDHLQALLGRPVDLVTLRGLKPRARAHVERDLVRVA